MKRPIFLSYRRTDSADSTARLYGALRERFGPDSVFMDSSSTAWGEDWPTALERAVAAADVVVVVIGRDWLLATTTGDVAGSTNPATGSGANLR